MNWDDRKLKRNFCAVGEWVTAVINSTWTPTKEFCEHPRSISAVSVNNIQTVQFPRILIDISSNCWVTSPHTSHLPFKTKVPRHRSSSLAIALYASRVMAGRKSWISQGCRVITLGLDEAQQLTYAHPSQPKTLHLFLIFFVSHFNSEIWRWTTWVMLWIHHANLFDMAKVFAQRWKIN